MKRFLVRLSTTIVLALALGLTAFAGDMQTGLAGDMQTGLAGDMQTGLTATAIQLLAIA